MSRTKTDPADYRGRLMRVLLHIEGHLDGELALDELAALAHFSPFHFHRIFRGLMGEGVAAYVRRLRLARAAHRLTYSGMSVLGVALEAGYEAPESFLRAFRSAFGMAPSEWRATRGSGAEWPPCLMVPDLKPGQGDDMDIEIIMLPVMRVAFVRHTGPYMECGRAWERLCAWAGPRGLLGPQASFIGVSHDDPEVTPPEKIRYDACVTVGPEVTAEGEIGVREIAGREYAAALHKGPYEGLFGAYAEACARVAARGRELATEPCLELYLNDPDATPPEELLTRIHLPLEPRK